MPGFRLNEIVTDGNCPEWLTASGPYDGSSLATVFNGMSCPAVLRTYSNESAPGSFSNSGSSSMITWYSLFGA